MKKKRILFVCPYPFDEAPSQRFRYEQYLKILENEGHDFQIAPFLNKKAWDNLYKSGHHLQKIIWLIISFANRFTLLFRLSSYEIIFIHREATPVGPPFFEWAVRFLWKKKMVYDFDDAIWLEDPTEKGSLKVILKWKSKVKNICKWSYKISCGNEYLADYAKNFNSRVIINPTTIDTNYHKPFPYKKQHNKAVIGWTGTQSTLPYLKKLLPVLDKLNEDMNFELLVISNQKPSFDVSYMHYIPWNKSTEIQDLNRLDIGIMPLTNDIWSKGKCGFKMLQYMALGKAVIASPVGINNRILEESNGGIKAENEEEWRNNLQYLINYTDKSRELGKNGREYIKTHFSIDSNQSTFLSLMD